MNIKRPSVRQWAANVFGHLIMGLLALLAVAFFVALLILKQWRWSCG